MNRLEILRRELTAVLDVSEMTDNDADGLNITPHRWNWTAYTIYPIGSEYRVYAAMPDIHKGIDVEDEKLMLQGTIFAVQSFLRGALNRPVEHDEYLRIGLKLAQTHE